MFTAGTPAPLFKTKALVCFLVSIICLMNPQMAFSQNENLSDKLDGLRKQMQDMRQQMNGLGNSTDTPATKANPNAGAIGDKWAIVIGSSKFKDPTIPGYNTGAKNATDFAAFLTSKCNFPADHVQLLIDESATRAQWANLVGDSFLPRRVKKNDLVVLYFSGYVSSPKEDVSGSTFFCTYDTNRDSLYRSGLEVQELARILKERARGTKALIIFDTKPLPASTANKSPSGVDPHDIDNSKSADVVYMSASLTGSESRDARKGGDSEFLGAFMKAVLKAGPDATLDRVFVSTKEAVQAAVKKDYGASAEQTPQIGGDADLIKSIVLMAPSSGNQEAP